MTNGPLFSDALPDIAEVRRQERIDALRTIIADLDDVIAGKVRLETVHSALKMAVRLMEQGRTDASATSIHSRPEGEQQ